MVWRLTSTTYITCGDSLTDDFQRQCPVPDEILQSVKTDTLGLPIALIDGSSEGLSIGERNRTEIEQI